jgi:hypothetical protein
MAVLGAVQQKGMKMNKVIVAVALVLGLAFAGSAITSPVSAQSSTNVTCAVDYQFEPSRKLVVDGVADGVFVEGYIMDSMDEADVFITFLNGVAGVSIPTGTADRLLAIVVGDPEIGYTLMVFGYLNGCQIGSTSAMVPWQVEPGLLVDA